eukprot:3439565-Rhodomonas_salina.6
MAYSTDGVVVLITESGATRGSGQAEVRRGSIPRIVLRTRYAMSGTSLCPLYAVSGTHISYGATSVMTAVPPWPWYHPAYCATHLLRGVRRESRISGCARATRCPVLTWVWRYQAAVVRMRLMKEPLADAIAGYSATLSAYARATPCPVLKQRMLLPGSGLCAGRSQVRSALCGTDIAYGGYLATRWAVLP